MTGEGYRAEQFNGGDSKQWEESWEDISVNEEPELDRLMGEIHSAAGTTESFRRQKEAIRQATPWRNVEKPVAEEPVTEQAEVEEAAVVEPVTEQTVAEEPVVEEVTEETVAEEPVVEAEPNVPSMEERIAAKAEQFGEAMKPKFETKDDEWLRAEIANARALANRVTTESSKINIEALVRALEKEESRRKAEYEWQANRGAEIDDVKWRGETSAEVEREKKISKAFVGLKARGMKLLRVGMATLAVWGAMATPAIAVRTASAEGMTENMVGTEVDEDDEGFVAALESDSGEVSTVNNGGIGAFVRGMVAGAKDAMEESIGPNGLESINQEGKLNKKVEVMVNGEKRELEYHLVKEGTTYDRSMDVKTEAEKNDPANGAFGKNETDWAREDAALDSIKQDMEKLSDPFIIATMGIQLQAPGFEGARTPSDATRIAQEIKDGKLDYATLHNSVMETYVSKVNGRELIHNHLDMGEYYYSAGRHGAGDMATANLAVHPDQVSDFVYAEGMFSDEAIRTWFNLPADQEYKLLGLRDQCGGQLSIVLINREVGTSTIVTTDITEEGRIIPQNPVVPETPVITPENPVVPGNPVIPKIVNPETPTPEPEPEPIPTPNPNPNPTPEPTPEERLQGKTDKVLGNDSMDQQEQGGRDVVREGDEIKEAARDVDTSETGGGSVDEADQTAVLESSPGVSEVLSGVDVDRQAAERTSTETAYSEDTSGRQADTSSMLTEDAGARDFSSEASAPSQADQATSTSDSGTIDQSLSSGGTSQEQRAQDFASIVSEMDSGAAQSYESSGL